MNLHEIVDGIYAKLNVAAITSLLDGRIWRYNRPLNSKFRDIVVTADEDNVTVRLHAPNPITRPIGTEDKTFPSNEYRAIAVAVLNELGISNNTGQYIRDNSGEWYVSITFPVTSIIEQVTIQQLVTTRDNYGGYSAIWQPVAVVNAMQLNIKQGSQLNINGEYLLNMISDWQLPKSTEVKKSMRFVAPNGIYVIYGITTDNLVNTVRYDG